MPDPTEIKNPLDMDESNSPSGNNASAPTAPIVEEKKPVVNEPEKVKVKTVGLNENEITIKPQKLRNTRGEDVPVSDYFFASPGEKAVAPNFFNRSFGLPVDREDLIEIFDKIFKPEDNFLFLKSMNKEVYGVLIPLKFTHISHKEDSILADHQYHAISFVLDGSVNYDKLKMKLREVAKNIGYDTRFN